jgi:hypothetical protein
MQILFERSGGFAGMTVTLTVDTASLSADVAAQLRNLVAAADFFHLPAELLTPAQPDRFQYRVAIEENGQNHIVTVGEAGVPDTLRPLLEWLMEAARQR